jgi:hypothetical protein
MASQLANANHMVKTEKTQNAAPTYPSGENVRNKKGQGIKASQLAGANAKHTETKEKVPNVAPTAALAYPNGKVVRNAKGQRIRLGALLGARRRTLKVIDIKVPVRVRERAHVAASKVRALRT